MGLAPCYHDNWHALSFVFACRLYFEVVLCNLPVS